MECASKRADGGKWWTTILMAVIMVAAVLSLRQSLCGWLLPDGQFLESLVQQVQKGDEPLTEVFFFGVMEWFGDD